MRYDRRRIQRCVDDFSKNIVNFNRVMKSTITMIVWKSKKIKILIHRDEKHLTLHPQSRQCSFQFGRKEFKRSYGKKKK